ncbi:outer membrane beta-barrel protein [Algoriphagus litoralis]|uniref:outer membrane beta-barrel protein n=1 Tax=Algoriphagus litoralis TaxID=2202829 RepID=UPI000DB9F55C|nr:outer membrane beta-barrel protein [Algoriphagus litoralis]
MKKYILVLTFSFFAITAVGQSKYSVRGFGGFSGSRVATTKDYIGLGSVDMREFFEFGIIFSRKIGDRFSINSGISYLSSKVDFIPGSSCPNCSQILIAHNSDFRMISVPIFAEYDLGKVFFVSAGPLVDFQLSEGNNFDELSGLGYFVGMGARMNLGSFDFSLLPNYKRHGVVPFEKSEGAKYVLQELGIQLSLGYNF